jgi:hypothetical protein
MKGRDRFWMSTVAKLVSQKNTEEEDNTLEIDLEDEGVEAVSDCMAIAVYYSHKSYNPQVLLADMLMAWNIKKLAKLEEISDYIFRVEFMTPKEKTKAIEGGPRRHKGDAFIVTHYDGSVRPSEIRIESLDLWVRFYDLPPAMMKENIARMLGEQVGSFIRMDTRYPGYLRVRLAYLLTKPLEPKLWVRVKGRGMMEIMLHYENVPHFCFSCGCIGYAVANWDSGEDHEIRFGEELRASPPRRVREISMRTATSRVVWPLDQSMGIKTMRMARALPLSRSKCWIPRVQWTKKRRRPLKMIWRKVSRG